MVSHYQLIILAIIFTSAQLSAAAQGDIPLQNRLVDSQRSFHIEVAAAWNYSYVKLDGKYIHYEECWSQARSGLHLLVLHPTTGAVMARRFNPGFFKAGFTDIMEFLQRVQHGRIVVLCTQHEASFSLEPITREFFSRLAPYLVGIGQRSRFALVARLGGTTFAEGHVPRAVKTDHDGPLIVTADVPVDRALGEPCAWPDRTRAAERTRFCDKYEGFGRLCNCSDPDPIELPFRPLLHNRTFPNPIAVLGGDRGTYLYRMLQTLLPNRGLNKTMLTIFIQEYHDQILELASLLGVRVVVKTMGPSRQGGKISMNVKNAIQTSFELFPEADKLVVLEDDLYVSPDFVSYFAQTAPILDEDVTLYCVSAWNDISYRHSSVDPALLYRTSYFPGLGWMMKKSVLMGEMMPIWKPSWENWDWDMWFRTEELALYRECIVPDVSRTYHFAYLGGHVYSYLQYQYYADKSLNVVPDVELHTERMTFPKYRQSIFDLIPVLRLPPLKPFYRTCFEMFPATEDPEERKKPYVVVFQMKHAYDKLGILNLMTCLGLWDMDVRGEHRGTWRFHVNGNPVITVGVPYSEYAENVMRSLGVAPIFDFKKYDLSRMRVPSLDGGNPEVVTFGVPDEIYDDDESEEVRELDAPDNEPVDVNK